MPSLPNKTNRHKYTYLGILIIEVDNALSHLYTHNIKQKSIHTYLGILIIEVDSALGLLRRHHCCLALHAFTCRCLVLVILGKTLLPN